MKFTDFGGVTLASAIDEFSITPYGDAAKGINARELYNGLGMAQVDCWPEGHRATHKIDGTRVTIRRCGWRIQVWGVDDAEPAPDALAPPPGATDPARRQSSRVTIAAGFIEPPLAAPGFDLRGMTREDARAIPSAPTAAPAPNSGADLADDDLRAAAANVGRSLRNAASAILRRADRALRAL